MAEHETAASSDTLAEIPFLGSGMGFRREIKPAILDRREEIDFLEVITEQYTEDPRTLDELAAIRESFPVIPHGVSLSVGSAIPPYRELLSKIKEICEITRTPYYSEHLCMTRAPGIDIGHLSPLWFTEEMLGWVRDNVHRIQDYLGLPLILENVTYLFDLPEARMSQTEFFNRLVEDTGCGVLLDVTNVYINSANHEFDPVEFLDQMPLDRVVQLHLAGGYWSRGILIDGHSETVEDGTWDLLEVVARKARPRGSILEHDKNFPDIEELVATVGKARHILGWEQPTAMTA